MSISWVPLESNPDTMNKFIYEMGIPKDWALCDVFGLDPELLEMVPKPVLAVILLYPVNVQFEAANLENQKVDLSSGLFFMKQTIRNACGTVALIHALANNASNFKTDPNSLFAKFIEATKTMDPEERGKYLENSQDLSSIHENAALSGQTEAPNPQDDVTLHFVTFVLKDKEIFELDGRKPGPISHGPSTEETFLQDLASVLRKIMDRDPSNHNFNLVALAAKD